MREKTLLKYLEKRKENIITEKKNYPLHCLIEKSLMKKLKCEAEENKISLGEHCRRKLRQN